MERITVGYVSKKAGISGRKQHKYQYDITDEQKEKKECMIMSD